MEDSGPSKPHRLGRIVIVLGLLLCVVWMFYGHVHGTSASGQTPPAHAAQAPPQQSVTLPSPSSSSNSLGEPVPTTPPQTETSPAQPAGVSPSASGVPKSSATDSQAAVIAAGQALSVFSGAEFLPAAQQQNFVNSLATPEAAVTLRDVLPTTAPQLAKAFGYQTVADANASAQYYVEPQKFHVVAFDGTTATVSLYTITHWVNATGEEYSVPAIDVVHMIRVGSKWLYSSEASPPAAQPTPETGLTYDQTVARFQPYLKGYQTYEVP